MCEYGFLKVRNWETFQHYKNRNPPWIKLATDTFQNYDFGRLQDASKLLAICIWTLAARSEVGESGSIPNDLDWIKSQCGLGAEITKENMQELVSRGFISIASETLADCKQNACLEREGERDKRESRGESDKDPSDPAKPKSDLPEKKKRVVSAFNAFAEKKGWFALTGRPPKMTNDLLTKFCEDDVRFSKLDEYMRRVSESTMEACRIDVWLRERSFKKIMSGEWGPKEDAYAKPQEELDLSKPWNVRKEPA